jgi:hypothetical protein
MDTVAKRLYKLIANSEGGERGNSFSKVTFFNDELLIPRIGGDMKGKNYLLFLTTLCLVIFLCGCNPKVTILTPQDGDNFAEGQEITFSGKATDSSNSDLPDSALVWTVDGAEIGTGALIKKSDIEQGTHSVKLTATNAAGTGSAEISITVGEGGGNTTTTTTQPVDVNCTICPLDPPVITCDLSCMNNVNSTKQCAVCYTMDMSTGFTKIGYADGSYQTSGMDASTGKYATTTYDKYGNLCNVIAMDLGDTGEMTTSDSSGKECYTCTSQGSGDNYESTCVYNGKTYIEHTKQVGDETEISWTCPSGVTWEQDPSCNTGTGTTCPNLTSLPACK